MVIIWEATAVGSFSSSLGNGSSGHRRRKILLREFSYVRSISLAEKLLFCTEMFYIRYDRFDKDKLWDGASARASVNKTKNAF